MTSDHHPVLTHQQIDRLIALNRHLRRLEDWRLLRAKNLVDDFKKRAGASYGWEEYEDFELESTVQYYRAEPPDEEKEQEELILQTYFLSMPPLKWYYLNPTAEAERAAGIYESFHFNYYDMVQDIPRLNQERICLSFHDLHDHHGLDWQQVLEIERVWVDVQAIHQVGTTFGHSFGGAPK